MKKTLQTLLSLAVVAASLVSCAKETFKENVIPAGEKIQVAVGGSIGEFAPSDATKANAASVVKVTWEATDVVYVYDGSACLDSLEVTPNEDNPSNALLTGTITTSSVSPSNLSLVYVKGATKAPAINDGKISVDIGSQSGTAVTDVPFVLYATIEYDEEKLKKEEEFVPFKFATSVMTVNCTNLPTGAQNAKINVTKAEIEGVSTACELTIGGDGVKAVAGASTGTITRTAGFEQSDSRGSFKIALAADPAAPAARNILVYQGNKAYGAPFTSKTLAGGKSYNTVYQMSEFIVPPAEMLPGKFTVADPDGIANSGDETKVHFSPGNLIATIDATGAPTAWKFAANQYDYLGEGGANMTIGNTAGDVDLFGSSTSSTNYGISTSVDNADYSGNFKDWGKAYCGEKGLTDGIWRTLSAEEWFYLLNPYGEDNIRKDKFKWATVNGVAGCVIAPDNFDGELEELFVDDAALAEYNLVFLPAAGIRDGSEVFEVQEYGYYWSSTLYTSTNYACFLFFEDGLVDTNDAERFFGRSVRLVTESSDRGYAVKATGVTLNKNKITLNVHRSEILVATITPSNATNKQIIWSSSDEAVATVEQNGEVMGRGIGSAVITATTADGDFTAVCLIEIEPVKVTGVSLSKNETTIFVGAKETIVAAVTPSTATNKQVIWSSSNETVATVNQNGEVSGTGVGSSTITATTVDGLFTAECLVTVKPLPATGTAKRTGDIDVKWIQLWKDGPKFAEYNVGASSEADYGGYYAWGGNEDKVDDHNTDPYILTGTYDTATNLWGSNWRMPNSVELKGLFENCDIATTNNYNNSGKAGWIITGKGDYEPNSIFLPAAGFCSGGTLSQQNSTYFYWSSTPDNSNSSKAYATYNNKIESNQRSFGFTVRAVLNNAPATTGTAKATIGEVETDVHWVQLWAGGPKFAVYNVGVTDGKAESPGGYYAWGGSQDKVDDHNTGKSALSGESDTATNLWGSNWRMPTKEEFNALYNNCDRKWTDNSGKNGWTFTGKGDYASNSIFLPAAGYFDISNFGSVNVWGLYWSSTPDDTNANNAFRLCFSSGSYLTDSYKRNINFTVRAVLN